jgi:ribonucleoside-diphosphate reductase alpha subunit
MYVIKRSGDKVPVRYDSITDRNIELSKGLNIDVAYLSKMVIESLKNGMTTNEIDELSSETAAYMSSYEPDYDVLAARIAVSNHSKNTSDDFIGTMRTIHEFVNPNTNRKLNVISKSFLSFVETHRERIQNEINYANDFNYSYFGFKTLQRLYLIKLNGKIIERPQHMLMRVACTLHGPNPNEPNGNIDLAIQTYRDMSQGLYTHASPTLFNAGAENGQYSSCYLLHTEDDLRHIYETNSRCALISKHGGGIGIDISKVRAKGSIINSTNGVSDGIVPMIKVFNATSTYCNQCFVGSTKIFTPKGLESIEDIRPNELVLTHSNLFFPVDKVHKRLINEKIYTITTHREEFQPLQVTEKHCIMICTGIDGKKIYYEWRFVKDLQESNQMIYLEDQKPYTYILTNDINEDKGTIIINNENQINSILNTIISIGRIDFEGFVYDLTVMKDSTYHTLHGIVHNSGKRKGSFAMYLQPWHPDIVEFIALRYNNPPEELRARDIFLALWINDLFMERVEKDELWSLFCPSVVPLLNDTFGEEFNQIYLQAEREKKYMRQIRARDLWEKILHAQTETGLPYILYKDSINHKNMQSNLGVIRSSNLCAEIVEVTNRDSVAVCNLSSIALPKYIEMVHTKIGEEPIFDYQKLYQITKTIVRNIDNIIDINFYPVEEAKTNNINYRPMGIGIQGLADVFAIFKAPWGSEIATALNKSIFETIYYAAVEASHELALERGSYNGFEGSPYQQGLLQYKLWNVTPSSNYDWKELEEKVKKGMRNSLLIALMPTASSSQILNNNECFEPFTSNLYSRNTLAGDFIMLNKHLVKDLKTIGLWNRELVNQIIENDGSIQMIDEIPRHLREVYKTVWEISQKIVIDYAADRAPFVDQTQSMNIFMDHPTNAKLSSMHMYGWKKGLKTGSYYIRTKAARNAVKFSILKEQKKEEKKVGKEYMKNGKVMICTDDICTSCSA